jgi:four helix bundle protein
MNGNNSLPFPHHKLLAYQVALDFVRLVHATHISEAENRKHARESALSCARNLAEGAARRSRADKRRCYNIAYGELGESVCCIELDNALGGCPEDELDAVYRVGGRLNAMLAALTK